MANQEHEKYIAHNWKASERIDAELLNHMEKGIANLDSELYEKLGFISGFEAQTQQYIDRINAKLEQLDDLQTAVENRAKETIDDELDNFNNIVNSLATQASLNSLINKIYGSSEIDNGESDSLKAWIQSELSKLASSTTITDMQADIRALKTTDNNIQTILGNDYDIDSATLTAETISARLGNLSTGLSNLNDTVFGTSTSGSTKTIVQQIADLNNAIFGSASGGESSGSLIDKIVKAMGRSLDLESGETIDSKTGAYSNSLEAQINEIKGTLGMDGGTSGGTSTLINDVDTLLNLIYGYKFIEEHEDPNNDESPVINRTLIRNNAPDLNILNITSNYPTLYNDFYTTTLTYNDVEKNDINATKTTQNGIIAILNSLGSDFGKVATDAKAAKSAINTYENELKNISKAYSKAFPTVIGEDTYLVLSPIDQEAQDEETATTVDQIPNKKSTYVILPKGGGGGGAVSSYYTRIENVTRPQNRNISVGDDYIYSFYWMAYQLVDGQSEQQETFGEMRVTIDGVTVLTRTVESGEKVLNNGEYEYTQGLITINLGPYIQSAGRKNISIVISAENSNYIDSLLSGYVVAYAPTLLVDLNIERVFSSNNISFSYLATVGSSDIEKILCVEIDEVEIPVNISTYSEASYTNTTIPTPDTDGGHLLTIYFKYKLDQDSPLLPSSRYNYNIITNKSAFTAPYISIDIPSQVELTQYDILTVNYMVYGSLSESHNITISILNSSGNIVNIEHLVANNLISSTTPWSYSFDDSGIFTIQFVVDDNDATKKTSTIVVHSNQQYEFTLQQTPYLLLNLIPNGRSNQELPSTIATWNNNLPNIGDGERTPTIYDNISIDMENFLFSDQNRYDGWLKDENSKPILRLRNTDKVRINNCPLLRQADIDTGLTFEIEFKTSDVVNLNTVFFSQEDAGLNAPQLQETLTSRWNTEKQYRKDIDTWYTSHYNKGTGEYYESVYNPNYETILNKLVEENEKLAEEEQRELEVLQEEAQEAAVEKTKEDILKSAIHEVVGDNDRPYEAWTEEDYQTEFNRLATEQSIILTPQSFIANARAQTILQYKEEELTTISYVFNPRSSDDDSLLIYCYINGILSNIKQYDQALNQSLNSFVEIGSTECTTDIYAIRLYNKALNSREVVQNWIYGLSNTIDKVNAYNRNNYGNAVITEEVFKAHSKDTPYMVITASGPLESEDAMPQAKGSKYATTVRLRYVDQMHPENNFTSSETTIQVQGTSSQYYPRKNYKLKLANFTQNKVLHLPKNEDNQENVSTEGYKLFSNSIPVFNFCIKADYASSEGVNNTGLARIYDDVVRSFYLTPAQQLDSSNSIRQAVDGKPMVVFYEEGYIDETSGQMAYKTPYFLGKYNFNNDKGTHEVFGLTTFQDNAIEKKDKLTGKKSVHPTNLPYIGDESWEGADNFYPLNIFMPISITGERGMNKAEDLTTADWKATFPARFPTIWEDYPEYAVHDSWYEAIKWVYSTRTVVWKQDPNTKKYYDATLNENEPDYYVGPEDGKTREEVLQAHLKEFHDHFEDYFNLDAIRFFYCFTEFFLMVDNRAKNMFWTRYLTTGNRDPEAVLAAGEEQTYDKYFSLPYDFDTAMGIDNQGMFQFNYNLESKDAFMPDGSLIFNGHPSIFWTNFIQAFEPEINETFTQLLGNNFTNPLYPDDPTKVFKFNYNTIEKRLEEHQSAWSETIFNEDAIFKYIKAHANYFMAQGSKREQRQWWLYNRFRYFNSKYRSGGISSTDNINIRANAAGEIEVSTIADCYVTFQLGSDDGVIESLDTQRALVSDGAVKLKLPEITANNSVINIYPASAIRSITGLSSLELQTVNFNAAKKIQYLTIGSNSTINTTLTTVNIGQNPLLRHLDVRNCRGFNTALQLQICSSLETIYLAGTSISSITLPNGGVIKTVQYPTSITEIIISNQPYLQYVIVGNYLPEDEIALGREGNPIPARIPVANYDKILKVAFTNTGATNDIANIIINSSNINNCTLQDLKFTMTGEEFKTLFNKLINIRNINDQELGIIGQVIIKNCSLYITDQLPDDLTINEITSHFDFKVFAKDKEGNWVEYYNVRFFGFNKEYLLTKSVIKGGLVEGPKELFTDEYVKNYNNITDDNMSTHPTMEDFDYWDKASIDQITEETPANEILTIKNTIENVTGDLDVFAVTATKHRVDFILQTADIDVQEVQYRYFFVGDAITGPNPLPFIRDYYKYEYTYWTDAPNDSPPPNVGTPRKKEGVETLYAVYSKTYAQYDIYIYTTNDKGEKVGEPINKDAPIQKTVLGKTNTITFNEISSYLPTHSTNGPQIVMAGDEEEIGIANAERKYKYLGTRPYIPSNSGLRVTGNMDILITYYYDGIGEDNGDVFTKYFLNKLTKLDLTGTSLTSFPAYAFNHNTELLSLKSNAYNIGAYSFINFYEGSKRKIFIFNNGAHDVTVGERSFYDLNNTLMIFTGSGNIYVDKWSFNFMKNCTIIMLPPTNMVGTLIPIQAISDVTSSFSSFVDNNNILYVPQATYNLYPEEKYNSTYPKTPHNLINGQAKTGIRAIENYKTDVNTLLREAGLDDKQLN